MRLALLPLPLLMLTACATTASPPLELAGTRWQLASGNGAFAAADARVVTAEFTADKISGNGGCNQYNGSYTLADGKLRVGPLVSTKRACVGPGDAIESAWFTLLGQPVEVSRVDADLQLRGAGGETLRLAPAAAR